MLKMLLCLVGIHTWRNHPQGRQGPHMRHCVYCGKKVKNKPQRRGRGRKW